MLQINQRSGTKHSRFSPFYIRMKIGYIRKSEKVPPSTYWNEWCLYRIRTIALVLIFARSYVDKQSEERYVNIDTPDCLYKVYGQRMYLPHGLYSATIYPSFEIEPSDLGKGFLVPRPSRYISLNTWLIRIPCARVERYEKCCHIQAFSQIDSNSSVIKRCALFKASFHARAWNSE